jgi:hypothetical protein
MAVTQPVWPLSSPRRKRGSACISREGWHGLQRQRARRVSTAASRNHPTCAAAATLTDGQRHDADGTTHASPQRSFSANDRETRGRSAPMTRTRSQGGHHQRATSRRAHRQFTRDTRRRRRISQRASRAAALHKLHNTAERCGGAAGTGNSDSRGGAHQTPHTTQTTNLPFENPSRPPPVSRRRPWACKCRLGRERPLHV